MTKIKSLHKQVELFHKLASYGDRSAFLEAVAQQATLTGPMPPMPGTPKPTLRQFFSPQKSTSPDATYPVSKDMSWTPVGVMPTKDLEKTQVLPEQKIVGDLPAKQYPAISPEVQDHLNQLLVPGGEIMPLKLDGKLGPETQRAAQLFKQKYNKPATPANIKEEYLAAKHPELETKFPA